MLLPRRLALEGISLDLAIESFVSCFITSLVYKRKLQKMELSLSHTLRLFNIFCEYDGKENCAQVLEEEIYKMFCTKSLNDEHDCNVISMNSLNTHAANDMQSHKLGDAMFDEDDIFFLPQALMSKFIMMKACLLFMMIILMKVGLEECQL